MDLGALLLIRRSSVRVTHDPPPNPYWERCSVQAAVEISSKPLRSETLVVFLCLLVPHWQSILIAMISKILCPSTLNH